MTAAILLCTIIVLVMLTNMREQRTATRISTAVTSIYEDRLVVEQYILKLSKQVDGIITILERKDENVTKLISERLIDVDEINKLYDKTLLTETEKTNFENFKQLCQSISENNRINNHEETLKAAYQADVILDTLSSIQLEEGKKQLDDVLKMNYFSNIFSYLELTILIIIAVIIQILVFASKTMMGAKKPKNENLN